jgi:hypothetical protein
MPVEKLFSIIYSRQKLFNVYLPWLRTILVYKVIREVISSTNSKVHDDEEFLIKWSPK